MGNPLVECRLGSNIILQVKPNTPKASKEQYGKSMCQMQAAVAMEQQQVRLDVIATAPAGPSM